VSQQSCRLAGYGVVLLLAIRRDPGVNRRWFVHPLSPKFVGRGLILRLRPAGVDLAPALERLGPACRTANGQNDTPIEESVAEVAWPQPRPRPRSSSASNARLTTSLIESCLTDAYNRTR
jgi:hypothetical protein